MDIKLILGVMTLLFLPFTTGSSGKNSFMHVLNRNPSIQDSILFQALSLWEKRNKKWTSKGKTNLDQATKYPLTVLLGQEYKIKIRISYRLVIYLCHSASHATCHSANSILLLPSPVLRAYFTKYCSGGRKDEEINQE